MVVRELNGQEEGIAWSAEEVGDELGSRAGRTGLGGGGGGGGDETQERATVSPEGWQG